MQYNHIEIVSVTSDSAVMSLDIRRDTTNIYGYVHGGAFFTMADCCAGLTARSDGRQYVTQNASVNFIHNVKAGHLTARGRTVSRRRHICVVAVEITDETDTLLFSSTLFHVLYQRRGLTALSSPHCARFCVPVRGFFYVQRILSAARSSPGNILDRQQPAFRRGNPTIQLPQHQLDALPRHLLHGQIDHAQARDRKRIGFLRAVAYSDQPGQLFADISSLTKKPATHHAQWPRNRRTLRPAAAASTHAARRCETAS